MMRCVSCQWISKPIVMCVRASVNPRLCVCVLYIRRLKMYWVYVPVSAHAFVNVQPYLSFFFFFFTLPGIEKHSEHTSAHRRLTKFKFQRHLRVIYISKLEIMRVYDEWHDHGIIKRKHSLAHTSISNLEVVFRFGILLLLRFCFGFCTCSPPLCHSFKL